MSWTFTRIYTIQSYKAEFLTKFIYQFNLHLVLEVGKTDTQNSVTLMIVKDKIYNLRKNAQIRFKDKLSTLLMNNAVT